MYETVEMRKTREADRRARIPEILNDRLANYARKAGGRFLLYGSLARGHVRFDSDVDMLLDFPPSSEGEAWRLVEEICAELGVEADVKPLNWCDPKFASKVIPHARIIG